MRTEDHGQRAEDLKLENAVRAAFADIVAPDRVLKEVKEMAKNMEKMNKYQEQRRKKNFRRKIIAVGIAAAAMSVTVFAAAGLLLTERTLKEPVSPWIKQDTVGEKTENAKDDNGSRTQTANTNYWHTDAELSIMGNTDSPEYKAWEEWMNYQEEYDARGKQLRGEITEDKKNPPEAPYIFYDAVTPEMQERLDEISEKYKLTLHTEVKAYADQTGLYSILETEDFLDKAYDVSGYIYEDGTFTAEGYLSPAEGEHYYSMFVQPSGSFTAISEPLYDPEELEEWAYRTEDGSEVTLVYGPRACYILAGTGKASFTGFWHTIAEDGKTSLDRESLEKLADGIRFSVLAERFAG